jgi:eukaryotic-like serine/threonine-protein kinase
LSIQTGSRLGPYEVVSRIGAGGMGEVWRARDTRLERDVAIKVLPAEFSDNVQLKLRFEREARTISQLNHPNICVVHDVGEAVVAGRAGVASSSLAYLVMELLEGETLADRLARGPLPLAEVLKYGAQIAEALDRAHRAGIVHRDLKPGNVILTKSGAKLLDFGLAKSGAVIGIRTPPSAPMPVADEATAYRRDQPLTQEGTIVGTFQYMAPEQLEGGAADHRSDLFALGCVLYEMTTGQRTFDGKTKTSLIAQIVGGEPRSIRELQPLTPAALEHVIARCLEKSPDDRWQSAHDLASELRWISEAGSQAGVAVPVAVRRKTRERLAWGIAAAAVLLAALSAIIAVGLAKTPPGRRVVAGIAPPAAASLIPFDELGVALSPDGSRLAFAAFEGGGQRRIWVRELAAGASIPIPGTEGAWYPFWSPDNQHLAYFAQGKLKRVDLRGGAAQVIAAAPSGRGGSWGADDVILYAPNIRTSIYAVPAAGGTPKQLTSFDPASETTHRWPLLLPDGRHFVYVSRSRGQAGGDKGRLMLASLDGKTSKQLIEDSTNAVHVPGYLLHGRGTTLIAQPFDLRRLELSGRPIPIVDRGISFWEPKNLILFTAAGDGTLVYLPDSPRRSELQWVDRQGRLLEKISSPEFQHNARLSHDGKKIAVIRAEQAGTSDLWVHDLEYGRISRLTFGGEAKAHPRWSRDGRKFAFVCDPSGVHDLCVKELDRPGETRVVVATPNWTTTGSWSLDGNAIYAGDQDPEFNNDLVLYPVEGGGEPKLILRTPFNEDYPELSPDGRWLAYVSNETGTDEVFLRDSDGTPGQWQISKGGGSVARWRGDGREIFYLSPEGRMMVVAIESLAPVRIGEPKVLFDLPGEPHRDEPVFQDISADGQRILLNVPTENRSSVGFQIVLNWWSQLTRE